MIIAPLALLSQINQTDANGLRQGLWKKQYPNGRIMYEGNFKNGKPAGEWKRWYETGFIKAQVFYSPASDSAKAVLFNEIGKKMAEGTFINEKRVGKWTFFAENRKISEENYVNGLKQGICYKYYETGEVMEESAWVNGIQTGKYQLFLKTGQPYLQCKFAGNKRNGLFLTFFESGKRETEGGYKDNFKQGDWKYFSQTGELLYTLKYEQGQILNPAVLDSIENLQLKNLEKNRAILIDPEKYMENPMEYMTKINIVR